MHHLLPARVRDGQSPPFLTTRPAWRWLLPLLVLLGSAAGAPARATAINSTMAPIVSAGGSHSYGFTHQPTAGSAVSYLRPAYPYKVAGPGMLPGSTRLLATLDLAATGLATPTATQGCYGSAEAVSVAVTNAGTSALDFATNPATVTAVVTTPSGSQTLTGSVSTGTLAAGATRTVVLTSTLDMTALGTYTFDLTGTVSGDENTANDLLSPSPALTSVAPAAGSLAPASSTLCFSGTAVLTLTGAANGTVQYQRSTDGTTFTDIAGATSATYTTPTLTATTYYRVQVRCGTRAATSNVSTVTVNNPQVTSTNGPVAICSGSPATLTATAAPGSSVRFFATATGGAFLATAAAGSYTTPALTASTTYYAEAYSNNSERVGPVDNNLGSGTGVNYDYSLLFNVSSPTTLAGVYVYPTAAGVSNIQLASSSGTVLQTYQATFTTSSLNVKTFVPLNFSLPAGTGLQLRLVAASSTASLFRNTGGAAYPYTSPSGNVSITGNTLNATYYYYFYDWVLGGQCVGTARTAIQVNVTQPGTATFPRATASTCTSTPYQLAGTVGGSATTGTYTSSGTGSFAPSATTLNATYTPSAADIAAGSVIITLTAPAAGGCPAATATLTLSIGATPVAAFSYSSATTACAGGTNTLAPALAPDGTAGTFAASPAGLTIDAATGVITLSTSAAGTYTVTNSVAASGSCGAASATATVTVVAPGGATTWTGATSTDWFTSSNWTNCVPTRTSNVTIPAGAPRYPALSNASTAAEANNLAVASNASLSQATGTLNVYGNLTSNTGATTSFGGGTVALLGAAPTVTGSWAFYNLTVNLSSATGAATLGSNLGVVNALTLTQGVLNTAAYTLALNGTISESNTSYVTGKVQAQRTLAANTAQDFGNIGLTLTPTIALGSATVERTTGNSVTFNFTTGRQSILRYFTLRTTTAAVTRLGVVLSYFDHERNGTAAVALRLYSTYPTAPWVLEPSVSSGGSVTGTAAYSGNLSAYTLGDVNALPTLAASSPGLQVDAAPNPFGSRLALALSLPTAAPASLTLTDAVGRTVLRRELAAVPAGASTTELTGLDHLPSGVYLLRVKVADSTRTLKVVKE